MRGDFNTIIAAIWNHAFATPDRIAIIAKEGAVTYRELISNISNVADYYQRLALNSGDRILLTADSSAYFVYAYFAAHLVGAIAVPVEPQIAENRLRYIQEKVRPRVSFLLNTQNLLDLIGSVSSQKGVRVKEPKVFEHQLADILFSTGTTGVPKGVALTQRNIFAAAKQINAFIKNKESDQEIITLPLSHSFGLGRLRCVMLSGGTCVLLQGLSRLGDFFKRLDEGATAFSAVPTGISLILKLSGEKIGNYRNQIKYVEIGSAPMDLDQKKKLMDLLPDTRLCMHYGLTEASRSAFIEFHTHKKKLGSVGLPAPDVEIKIKRDPVSKDQGKIWVKGCHVMDAYWENETLTQEAKEGNWIATGDIGYQDDDGFLYLVGRETEMINVGGRKIAPVEIEDALKSYPGVIECACVGVRDLTGVNGELISAFIVMDESVTWPSKQSFVSFLRKEIEIYKIPYYFIQVTDIPKTSSGKIQRHQLRNQYAPTPAS